MEIIAITGLKRSGKDTICDYLVDKYGFQKLSFAGPLKDACKAIFKFSDEQLYGDEEKEKIDPRWDISPRKALQYVGTEMFRDMMGNIIQNLDKDIWLKCMEISIEECKNSKIVINDCRFENEIDFIIKKMNGTVHRVMRTNNTNINVNNNDIHSSEQNIMNFTINGKEIINNGTLNELYEKIDNLFDNKK